MGRGNRSQMGQSANPTRDTARENGYLGIEEYSTFQVGSETIECFVSDGRYSPEELSGARAALLRIEELARDPKERARLHEAGISEKDLRCAEAIFNELGEGVSGQMISESIDPDGVWNMDDSDHMYALAAYMRAIRQGRTVVGEGVGLDEARIEKYASIVDSARAQTKEA